MCVLQLVNMFRMQLLRFLRGNAPFAEDVQRKTEASSMVKSNANETIFLKIKNKIKDKKS